ncbi:MAG: 2-oxoglutarate dehydrogenase E1 component [Phycisphaerales bacterium]|nr:2-oxoglutarate dehydrogenase E1 component [Phycisphaerales bacterium]
MSGAQQPQAPRAVSPSVNSWSAEYLDAQYQQFLADPSGVAPDMAAFFQGFDLASARGAGAANSGGVSAVQSASEDLTAAYRALGHLRAKIDPFGTTREGPKALTLEYHKLASSDLDKPVRSEILPGGTGTLRQLIDALERSYCGSIGAEFMHIPDDAERAWFRERFEGSLRPAPLNASEKREVLEQITSTDRFEFFLGKRFQGKKRFSVEGIEAVIPLLKFLTQRVGELGGKEIILGMAHRGRLAVLKNYLGKDAHKLFTEFKDAWMEGVNQGGGDVKYHRGYSGDQAINDAGGVVHLSMLNNPSHLESVNPIVMGRARAKQDLAGDAERRMVVALLIHGDAAVAGQGIVAECLNMSKLDGYDVGGTLHVVLNNQVGFTTDPRDGRSTEYCTDVAKMINSPVLHVSADDPDAVVAAARLAAEYRHQFRKDVFIDLVGFRRYGHNEQDEPTYTQPELYAKVAAHPGTMTTYRAKLVAEGVLSAAEAEAMAEREIAELDRVLEETARQPVNPVPPPGGGLWAGVTGNYTFDQPKTAVDAKVIAEVCAAMGRVPDGFSVSAKLVGSPDKPGVLTNRLNLPKTGKVAHADAEQIAIGTLVLEGTLVRLSGQDCRRGTFTQRQSVIRDQKTNERRTQLNHIRPDQKGRFDVWDSPLSEFSVMGFDYGYSRANPRALVMWEGQFGDFVNGAQVLIDQYLASSEVKWNRWAGLVLLLPHGYEGQGPEHSSARLERFLQLCANDNMEVVYPSTAAQMFHLLRRQVHRNFRKPLIVMTPKKYLRIETSAMSDLSTGGFQHAIDDPAQPMAKDVKKVVYCTGKVYHELNERRNAIGARDIAIVRIEQLYPFHTKAVRAIDDRYPKSATRVWAQEEPRNQGAYIFIADVFREQLGVNLQYAGRAACASPATGSEKAHGLEQEAILTSVIGPPPAGASTDDKHGAPSGVVSHAGPNGASAKGAPASKGKR